MSNTDDHELITELMPAYALHCLDADEAERVVKHLATCTACQRDLASYQAVADMLPLALVEVTPSAMLKGRLFERIQGVTEETVVPLPSTSRLQTIQLTIRRTFTGPTWKPLTVSLILLLLILNFFLWWQIEQREPPGFEQFVLTGTEAAPAATGLIISSHDGHGTLIVTKLPELADNQEYQLWLIKNGTRISGGVFSVYGDGYQSLKIDAPEPLNSYTSFDITIEPGGGSLVPSGQRVLSYNL